MAVSETSKLADSSRIVTSARRPVGRRTSFGNLTLPWLSVMPSTVWIMVLVFCGYYREIARKSYLVRPEHSSSAPARPRSNPAGVPGIPWRSGWCEHENSRSPRAKELRPDGKGRFGRWGSSEKSFCAQVFIDVGPVDSISTTGYLTVLALFDSCMKQPRVPGKRGRDP